MTDQDRQHRARRADDGEGQGSEPVRHLAQKDLARRWACSARTLERWRVVGRGPRFLRLNGRVRYRLDDVEAFEAERLHESTAATRRQG